MSSLFFTIPVDHSRPDSDRHESHDSKQPPPSRFRTLLTVLLLCLWCGLAAWAVITAVNPVWLQKMSAGGIEVESRSLKHGGDICMLQKHDCSSALINYQRAVDINPNYDGARVNLGIAHIQCGDTALGVSILSQLMKKGVEQQGAIYLTLADLYAAKKQPEKALSYYRRSLGSEVDQALVYRNMGQAAIELKQHEVAEGYFKSSLISMTDPCSSYVGMLRRTFAAASDSQSREDIIALIERSVTIDDFACYDLTTHRIAYSQDPEVSKLHNQLGICAAQQGRIDESIQLFNHALAVWPGNPQSQSNLQHMIAAKKQRAKVDTSTGIVSAK